MKFMQPRRGLSAVEESRCLEKAFIVTALYIGIGIFLITQYFPPPGPEKNHKYTMTEKKALKDTVYYFVYGIPLCFCGFGLYYRWRISL